MPKIIRLPDKDDMQARLLRVQDDGTLQAVFYPELEKLAGQELYEQTLAVRLASAVAKVKREIPQTLAKDLIAAIPAFIDALVEDAEAAEEVKTAWLRLQRY